MIKIPNKLALIVVSLLIISWVSSKVIDTSRARQLEGQWVEFDSNDYQITANDPDGFQLSVPAHWKKFFHSGGGTKNLKELRASFESPYYLRVSATYCNVWWRRIDDTWTLQDAQAWFEDDLGFTLWDSEIEQKHDSWESTTIGFQKYPALTQTFTRLRGKNPRMQVTLLVVRDEAFALVMQDDDVDEETEARFQRMLDTFEVYR